ncbi:MAG: GNAT family N-acetyltransferase [Actinomycetes bacterium]
MVLRTLRSQSTESARGHLRVLGPVDAADLDGVFEQDRDAFCVVQERVERGALAAVTGGSQMWGWYTRTGLESAIHVGANVTPMRTNRAARRAFADQLGRTGRYSSAIVGDQREVLELWDLLSGQWGPARDICDDQPLLRMLGTPRVAADSLVRRATVDQLDALFPASVAMFEEEVGVSPIADGREDAYRARVLASIRAGRVYARVRDGYVLFKAEVGAASAYSCQIQGVWVDPALRGSGMAAPGMAAVVAAATRDHAPSVTLYANRHNVPALRTYARVGFRQIGTFATVLF